MKQETVENIVKVFTRNMTGLLYFQRKFRLVERYVELNIPFKWNWVHYKCEACNHVKQETVNHSIHTIEIYALAEEKKGDEPNYRIWLGYTGDKKIMSIPLLRRHELEKYLTD